MTPSSSALTFEEGGDAVAVLALLFVGEDPGACVHCFLLILAAVVEVGVCSRNAVGSLVADLVVYPVGAHFDCVREPETLSWELW